MFTGSAVSLALAIAIALSSQPPPSPSALDDWTASRPAPKLQQPGLAKMEARRERAELGPPPAAPPLKAAPQIKPLAPKAPPATPAPASAPVAASPPSLAKPSVPAPAASGAPGKLIQIGAFPSRREAEVALAKAAGDFTSLASRAHKVENVAVKGSTLFRAQFVGFGSTDEARQACATIRSAGGDCFVK